MADQLRDSVENSGLANHAVATAAGLDPSALNRFMAGTRSFTLDTAERVAAVLNLGLAPSVGVAAVRPASHVREQPGQVRRVANQPRRSGPPRLPAVEQPEPSPADGRHVGQAQPQRAEQLGDGARTPEPQDLAP